jgi:hypothetical protein
MEHPMRFKTRSSRRDEDSNANRIASIEQSIRKAIVDAEVEKTGLNRRIDKQRVQASVMIGNEIYGDLERHPEAEKLLTDAEREMLRGLARIRELNAHMDHLHGVLAALLEQK